MYDVIIIGSGPSGSTAAKILAENGLSVLILEKMKLPRYKSCSGCLINKSLNLVKEYFGQTVPHEVTCSPSENKGMVFVDDIGHEYVYSQPGLNVWRSSFDHWLAMQAVAAGAIIQDDTSVLSCIETSDAVSVLIRGKHNRTETAKYVIDCEGVAGIVKRKLTGIKPKLITTYQTFNKGNIDLDLQYFYAFLQPEYSEYDAWFNVKDDMLVLGVAVKNASNIKAYYHSFIEFMKATHGLNITKQIREDSWLMPWIRPGCSIDYAKGRVFFAGEAAGWLNPMGEGISCGMESAYHLSMAILDNYEHSQEIECSYRERTRELHAYMRRQWSLTGDMAGTFAEMK